MVRTILVRTRFMHRAVLLGFLLSLILNNFVLTSKATAFAGGDGSGGNPYQITTCDELQTVNSSLSASYILSNDIDCSATTTWNSGAGFVPIGNSSTKFTGQFDGQNYTISNLYIDRGSESYIGLFGYVDSSATIENLTLTDVDITGGASSTGGLVGRLSNVNITISNISINGSVSSATGDYVGGLVGYVYAGTIENAVSSATVSGDQYIGGLIGNLSASSNTQVMVSDSGATGDIRGNGKLGGLIGYKVYGTVTRSYATGNILGDLSMGTTNNESAGFTGGACYGIISNSYATGDVYGNDYIGGFIGISHNCSGTTVSDTYSRGTIYANPSSGDAGSYMGYDYLASIYRSYTTGQVVNRSTYSGFIYWNVGTASSSDDFYDQETTQQAASGVFGETATAKTSAEMKNVSTYTDTATAGLSNPWDFVGDPNDDVGANDYWNISASFNDGYPYLSWQDTNSSPDNPSSLGGASLVDSSWTSDTTPTLSFTLNDTDSSDTVKYQIQIDNEATFSTPLIDYTSALATQSSTSFTVNQAAGSGSYTTQAVSTLADGNYYWRVKAIDENSAASSYTTANSGSIAFKVDSTAPSNPGTPSTTETITTDSTPSWTWTVSTDSGSGLNSTPYTLQWSQASDFSGGINSTASTTNSYTHSTALDDGIWYFRVKAADSLNNFSSYSSNGSVTVDTTTPIITLLGTSNISIEVGDSFSDPGATATDAIAGNLTSSITTTGSVDTSTAGTYTIVYSVYDTAGNQTIKTRTITVNEVTTNSTSSAPSTSSTTSTTNQQSTNNATTYSGNQATQSTGINTDEEDTDQKEIKILLNNYLDFFTDEGKAVDLSKNQKVYFEITNKSSEKEEHSITVTNIIGNTVTLTIASDPISITMSAGETRFIDIDSDGVDDINIHLISIINNVAKISVSQIDQDTTNTTDLTSSKTKEKEEGFNPTLPIAISAIAITTTIAVVMDRRKKSNS